MDQPLPPPDATSPLDPLPERSPLRRVVGQLLITTTVALALGVTLRAPSQFEANDISRWCTVWSLLERGTYAIDDCPWAGKTQDKVRKPDTLSPPGPRASSLRRLEYRLAPESWKAGEPKPRFYSSKPPLLPTLIAGLLYPFRAATGVPLDAVTEQPRIEQWVERPVEGEPGKTERVKMVPESPVKWPSYVFYFKPVVVLLNIVPLLLSLVLFAGLLDRIATNDWAWCFSLAAAGLGTYLFAFDQTLNNHTVAAYGAFFALIPFLRIWDDGRPTPMRFVASGFFGAFCACNELPAALFGVLLFLMLLVRFPKRTLLYFAPAAAVPCVAFLATQFLAFGQFTPVYEEFGTSSYEYDESYWLNPLEMDWFNKHPEPWGVYLLHMTIGHHGVFSLTPIFLFSLVGIARHLRLRGRLAAMSWLSLALTVALFAVYTLNPKARNYGGSTQGLRWMFWLIPFWLIMLPSGVALGQNRSWVRWVSLAALAVSVLSVGYALRTPWSHPWLLDLLEHLGLYTLPR